MFLRADDERVVVAIERAGLVDERLLLFEASPAGLEFRASFPAFADVRILAARE